MHLVEKPIAEKTKGEIERKLSEMGDYVKMSYLQRALKSNLDFDTKKFVFLRLAGIYEERGMFLDAARLTRLAAEINTTFKNKAKDFMKSAELYVKGGDFDESDRIFNHALSFGDVRLKSEMKKALKDCYISQGKFCLDNKKRSQAKILYEKVLALDLGTGERKEIQEQLLELYNKLGLIRDYYKLKESMG